MESAGPSSKPGVNGALGPQDASKPIRPLHDSKHRHLARAAVVGVLAGLVAVAFRWTLAYAEQSRGHLLGWLHALPHANVWAWSILPLIGLASGCLVGWLLMRFSSEAAGSGIPHLKGVLLHVRIMRWKALLPVKFIAGVLGIGAGLSLGREGPTVQMGAAVGQAIATLLRVPSRSVPQLLSCGAGAGIAAAFNAPLAGFLFVIEELHRELSARTFGGALVAALSADIVARALGGELPSFGITGFAALPLSALPAAALIGIIGGCMGVAFNRLLLKSCAAAKSTRTLPPWSLPGVACAICGFVAWWYPEAVGGGHAIAEQLLGGALTWTLTALAFLFVAKLLLTLLSYASGAAGGIFAPILLLGAVIGAGGARGLGLYFPTLQTHETAIAVLGMAALFTGSVRAPLTGIVLIVEMTGNYQQLLALGVVCLVSDLVADALGDTPIYEALLEQDVRRSSAKSVKNSTGEPRTIYLGIQYGSSMAGRSIRDCGLPQGCLVAGIERAGKELLPGADVVLAPGDHLMIMIPDHESDKAAQVVRLATGL